jgi:hypothetical protein
LCGTHFIGFFSGGYHDIDEDRPVKPDRTALLIRLPRKLHRRFRIYAAERGLPMSRLAEAAITRLLRQRTQDKVIEQLLEQRAKEDEAFRALRRRRAKKESDHD